MKIEEKNYPIILLGYPRSGSNWISYIIENTTSLLVAGSKSDRMYHNKINSENCLVTLAHGNTRSFWNNYNKNDKLIMMVRNYKECIVRRSGPNYKAIIDQLKGISPIERKSDINLDYIANIKLFNKYKNKIMIYYEDLLDEPGKAINHLYEFLEIKPIISISQFMKHIQLHKKKSISIYGKKNSFTKGKSKLFHSYRLNKNTRLSIDEFIKKHHKEIFETYLKRYED